MAVKGLSAKHDCNRFLSVLYTNKSLLLGNVYLKHFFFQEQIEQMSVLSQARDEVLSTLKSQRQTEVGNNEAGKMQLEVRPAEFISDCT